MYISGKTIQINTYLGQTIGRLKQSIYSKVKLELRNIGYNGLQLSDDKTLREHKVPAGAVLEQNIKVMLQSIYNGTFLKFNR